MRPGWFAQTHEHPELVGRTLLDILWRGDEHRAGMGREEASRALDRYELAHAAEQPFETLSGGQQARLQILLLELSGATLLLLDEPTDNLDLVSAEALEDGLAAFDGTVSRSPTTAGSPAASTGSWSSAPTARSTRRRAGVGRGPGRARPLSGLPCHRVSEATFRPEAGHRWLVRPRGDSPWPDSLAACTAGAARRPARAVALPAAADHTAVPDRVTLMGSLMTELGCAADWDEACAATDLPRVGRPRSSHGRSPSRPAATSSRSG